MFNTFIELHSTVLKQCVSIEAQIVRIKAQQMQRVDIIPNRRGRNEYAN